jgi:hypothetical protein
MIRTGQVIESAVTGEVLIFDKTARDTGGADILVETILRPGAFAAAALEDVRRPGVPHTLQRVALALGAPLGRAFGYRPSYEPAGAWR